MYSNKAKKRDNVLIVSKSSSSGFLIYSTFTKDHQDPMVLPQCAMYNEQLSWTIHPIICKEYPLKRIIVSIVTPELLGENSQEQGQLEWYQTHSFYSLHPLFCTGSSLEHLSFSWSAPGYLAEGISLDDIAYDVLVRGNNDDSYLSITCQLNFSELSLSPNCEILNILSFILHFNSDKDENLILILDIL